MADPNKGKKNKVNLVIRDHRHSRTFSYQMGNVTLSFSLRTDIKTELKDFLSCLEEAQKDVTEELESKP